MIEITIKDEISTVLNKDIIVRKFARACNDIGLDVSRYVLTEYFENGRPCGYTINFTHEG